MRYLQFLIIIVSVMGPYHEVFKLDAVNPNNTSSDNNPIDYEMLCNKNVDGGIK